GGYTTTITNTGEVAWHPPPALDHGQTRINYHHRPELLLTPPQNPEPDPNEPKREAEPELERQAEPEPGRDAEHEPQGEPQWDAQREPHGDTIADPDWHPESIPECDLEAILEWDREWANMYDQPTPTPPSAEDIDDDPAAIDTNPDTDEYPDPWQSIGNDYAHGGKGIRGP
ncbi:hypothetical protein M1247_20735, partial [Mycobacterium sp. 21AC1]|nr:hypothetical protein [Mycobacterium sp. 21AC1]